MVTTINIENVSAQISDLLEQIYKLNVLIAIKRESDEPSMAAQYEHLREQFYEKLKIALAESLDIDAEFHYRRKDAA
jgi:hypothetical protein